MRNLLSKVVKVGLFLHLVLILSGCAAAGATIAPAVVWKIDVSKVEIKDQLSYVESVTQYDGSKLNVTHQQSPDSGNTYVILNTAISKSGDQAVSFDWSKLSLVDQSGGVYARHKNDTFLELYNYKPRLTGLEIRFGVNAGWLCFEIPAQAAQGKLTLKYSADDSRQEIVLQK
jgi:hypothetical protein